MKLMISKQFQEFIRSLGLPIEDLLKRADIPNSLWKDHLELSDTDYFRLFQELDRITTDQQLLDFSQIEHLHSFMPPFYAALASKNGEEAIERFSTYKRLVGPVKVELEKCSNHLAIHFSFLGKENELPRFAILNEQLLLISLLRTGTKDSTIKPISIESPFVYGAELEKYIGLPATYNKRNQLIFAVADLTETFFTQNNPMLEYLEPELKRRLNSLSTNETFTEWLQKELFSAIPSGQCSLKAVSQTFGMSARNLQRKLAAEQTTFHEQVQLTKKILAERYLQETSLPTIDVAYLLGYTEPSSFARAFKSWTGKTISEVKSN